MNKFLKGAAGKLLSWELKAGHPDIRMRGEGSPQGKESEVYTGPKVEKPRVSEKQDRAEGKRKESELSSQEPGG